jgi:hypothetical protein
MLRASCDVFSLAMADTLFQCRSSGRFRGRLASERATIQHTSRHPLCRLHLNADTFVSIHNDLPVSFSMTFQEYVFELYWKALHISPCFHDALGCDIDFNRSRADVPFTPSAHVFAGTTHNFTGALLTRFFLGFVEAAFFPGALFLLSKWYKRSELGLRTAYLSCGMLTSNAFGSLLASGILSGMQGKFGFAAWRSVAFIWAVKLSQLYSPQVAFFHRRRPDNPGRCCRRIRTSRFSSKFSLVPLGGGDASRRTPHARRRRDRRWR